MSDERDEVIVLLGDNGEEIEFEHLDTIEMNGNKYVVLLPLEDGEVDEETDEVVILKVAVQEDGEEALVNIEDDDELNEVFEEFKDRVEDEYDFTDDE